MGRVRHILAVGLAVVATVASSATAASAATTETATVYLCTGNATWNVSPATNSASWAMFGASCTSADGSFGPGLLDNSVTTSSSLLGAFNSTVNYIPVLNTTAPVGAFAGVIAPGAGTLTGTISGVNGVGLVVSLVSDWTATAPPSGGVQFATFTGVNSCGAYCFNTTVVWEGVVAGA